MTLARQPEHPGSKSSATEASGSPTHAAQAEKFAYIKLDIQTPACLRALSRLLSDT